MWNRSTHSGSEPRPRKTNSSGRSEPVCGSDNPFGLGILRTSSARPRPPRQQTTSSVPPANPNQNTARGKPSNPLVTGWGIVRGCTVHPEVRTQQALGNPGFGAGPRTSSAQVEHPIIPRRRGLQPLTVLSLGTRPSARFRRGRPVLPSTGPRASTATRATSERWDYCSHPMSPWNVLRPPVRGRGRVGR
jgi:hypothetical protein